MPTAGWRDYYSDTYEDDMRSGDFWNTASNDDYVLNTLLHDELTTLWKTQRVAALDQGFDVRPIDSKNDQVWRNYIDQGNTFGYPSSAEELQHQLNVIAAMDRTPEQQAFLGQTQYTKYLFNYLDEIGATDKVYDMLVTPPESFWQYQTEFFNSQDEPSPRGVLGEEYMWEYALPWLQPGDNILPDFMMDHLTDAQKANLEDAKTTMWDSWGNDDTFPRIGDTYTDFFWGKPKDETEEEDEPSEEQQSEEQPPHDTDKIAPFITVGGIKYPNPDYRGDTEVEDDEFGTQQRPDPNVGWGTAEATHQFDADSWGLDLPDGYRYEEPTNPTQSLIFGPDDFYGSQSEMWADIDNRKILAERDRRKADREAEREQNRQDQKDASQAQADQKATELAAHIEQDQGQHLTNLTAFQEYIAEEHPADFDPTSDQHEYDWLAVGLHGENALFGDNTLEERLGLPDEIKAVQSSQGVIHQFFDPTQVQPAFSSIQPAGHQAG